MRAPSKEIDVQGPASLGSVFELGYSRARGTAQGIRPRETDVILFRVSL